MPGGGVQPGAGRPKGTVGRPVKLSRVRAHEIATSGNAPIDVMLNNMLYWHQHAMSMTEQFKAIVIVGDFNSEDPEERRQVMEQRKEAMVLLRDLLAARENSQRCAVDLAPYVHARLASVTLKGDPNAPLNVKIQPGQPLKTLAEAYGEILREEKERVPVE